MKGLHELGFLQSDSKAVTHQSGDLRSTEFFKQGIASYR